MGEVSSALSRVVDKLCSAHATGRVHVLDAPSYFFVSTNVAQRFPDLIESIIVRNYHTSSPGPLAQKWKPSPKAVNGTEPRSTGSRYPWLSMLYCAPLNMFVSLMAAIQTFGACPFFVQRFVLRAVQPGVFTGEDYVTLHVTHVL